MAEQHYKVEVQEDHLERLANARPVQAVAELVWNGLDADAKSVDVTVEVTDFGMQSITVVDTGHGIPHADAPELFKKLGGSWKAHGSRSNGEGRTLHGKEGKGRFKALALGRVADWTVTYEEDEDLRRYTITLIRDDLVDVRVSDPVQIESGRTGVEVKVSELHREFRSLEEDAAIQELVETFAIYLSEYPKVTISYQGIKLDPSKAQGYCI